MLKASIVHGFVSACVAASLAACSGARNTGSTLQDADAQAQTGDNFQATIYNQTKNTVTLNVFTDDGKPISVDIAPGGKYQTYKYDFHYEQNASQNDASLKNANIQEDAIHVMGTVKGLAGSFKETPWLTDKDLKDADSGDNGSFLDDRVATLPPAAAPAAGDVAFDQRFAVHKVASTISDSNGNAHEGIWAAAIKESGGVVTVITMAGGSGKVGGVNQCTGSTDVQFAHVSDKGKLGDDRGCGNFQ